MINVILNPDRTRKTIVAVNEITARAPEYPVDIQETDIFIENAPDIPDGLLVPKLLEDNVTWVEGAAAEQLAQRDSDDFESAMEVMEQRLESYTQEVARQRRYRLDAIHIWKNSTDPVIAAEAAAFITWYESFWQAAAQVEAAVRAGTRTAPSYEELIAELPQMVWP